MLRVLLIASLVAACAPTQAGNLALETKAGAAEPAYQQAGAKNLKPVHPGAVWLRKVDNFLSNFDCAKPDFREDLLALENLKGLEDVLSEHVAEVPDLRADAIYGEMLKAWLLDQLRNKGGLINEQIESLLEADPGISRAEQVADFTRQAEIGNRLGEAEDTRNGMAMCEAVRDIYLYDWQVSKRRADRLAVLNAALEAETKRLGIALD
ncbi:hypothetical protein [Altererythrobacter sp. Z27]|uniref:hypothetical protein n=1 Tax=Altererythrobacter sp. Z27 TaxID=3461147 RepID=UPI004043F6B2